MEQLGLNPISLIAQVVNFGIILFVLNKFVFKTIIKIVEEQRKLAQEAEKRSEQITQEWQAIDKVKEEEFKKAKKEAAAIVSQARLEAEDLRKEINSKANNEARKILSEADLEIKERQTKMKIEVKKYSANLAVKIASQLVADFLDKDKQKKLAQSAIAGLKNIKI